MTVEHRSNRYPRTGTAESYTEVISKGRKRIGTGPLDNFFNPQSSSSNQIDEDTVTEGIYDSSELNGDNDDYESDDDARVIGMGHNILEAKNRLEGKKLIDAAGQVFAQSLDNLSNIDVDSSSSSSRTVFRRPPKKGKQEEQK